MIENIIYAIIIILIGVCLIVDAINYKFSKPYADQNFSRWLFGITGIIGGIYIIISTLIKLLRN
jgi:hypothetical protein